MKREKQSSFDAEYGKEKAAHMMMSQLQYFDKKAVGERIRQMRQKNQMTQRKLAELLGYMNHRQLLRIENGQTACSIDKLMEIAQILHTSADYLLFGDGYGFSKTEHILTELLDGKTEGEKEYAYCLLKAAMDNLKLTK